MSSARHASIHPPASRHQAGTGSDPKRLCLTFVPSLGVSIPTLPRHPEAGRQGGREGCFLPPCIQMKQAALTPSLAAPRSAPGSAARTTSHCTSLGVTHALVHHLPHSLPPLPSSLLPCHRCRQQPPVSIHPPSKSPMGGGGGWRCRGRVTEYHSVLCLRTLAPWEQTSAAAALCRGQTCGQTVRRGAPTHRRRSTTR